MKNDTTQTIASQWGREPITVDALVPTRAISYHLARVHVGTPMDEVLDDTREQIAKVAVGAMAELWTDERVEQTLAFTEWQHLENRAEYAAVMGASL